MKPAYTIFLKSSAACNAGCITCPAGRKYPEEKPYGASMRPEMLERILNRVEEQAKIISLAYHYYNEPTMIPWIDELVYIGQVKHKINGVMSTNLSFFDSIPKILEHGLRNMIISVSGFSQEVHTRSHAHTNIEQIKENMRAIGKLKKPTTYVRVSWHRYKYNTHEEPLMKKFSEECGFHFTPYNTGVLPLERVLARWKDGQEDVAERDLLTRLQEAKQLCFERKDWNCIHQDRMITIDSEGNLHACCVKNHDANMDSSVFTTDLEEYNRWRREDDARCKACKAVGLHIYAMQQYRRPNTFGVRLVKKVEDTWRKNNLGGLFPWASAIWSDRAYSRPQKKEVSTKQ